MIALLALIPLRRRTLAALRIGKHVVKTGQVWALEIPPRIRKLGARSITQFRRNYRNVSMCIYRISAAVFPARIRTTVYGRPIKAVEWITDRFTSRFESDPKGVRFPRKSASFPPCSRNSVVNSGTPPTYVVRGTCWVRRHSKQQKGITSWPSHALPVALWLGPSVVTNEWHLPDLRAHN